MVEHRHQARRGPRVKPGWRFTVRDAVILIALVAVAVTLSRAAVVAAYLAPGRRPPIVYDRSLWEMGASCFGIVCSLGLLCMRLLQTTPPRRRIGQGPGSTACLAILAAAFLQSAWYLKADFFGPDDGVPIGTSLEVAICPHPIAFAVVGAWLAQWICRRWRPSRSCIDAMGIGLGLLFLVMTFLNVVIDRVLSLFPQNRTPWP